MSNGVIKIKALNRQIKRWDVVYIRPNLYLVVLISSTYFHLVPYTIINRIGYSLIRDYI